MPAAFAVLTLILFGDTLLVPDRVPAEMGSDLRAQYLPWREFAFSQIRQGHFPLWNPFAFCGTPFFADPQSALLYPPNWLFLFLSPARAASWIIAGHFFLAAYFMGAWRRARGASLTATILCGVLYACSGPIITNLRPGHLMLLCAAAWGPLLFWCADEIISASNATAIWKWVWIGAGVEALLQFNGYPQFCYYSGLAIGLYTLIHLPGCATRLRAMTGIVLIFAGGCAIAAVQILATAQFAAESVRAGGLPYATAADFSLAPENLLTLFVPGLFGDAVNFEYWGRWVWWEGCLFIGPAALVLAVFGAIKNQRNRHLAWLALALIVLALGASTPLFGVLYHLLPGFDHFRGTNRFGLLAVMCLAVLAGAGWDRLQGRVGRGMVIALGIIGAIIAAAAIRAALSETAGPGLFTRVVQSISATGQSQNISGNYQPTLPAQAAHFAARELATSAAIVLIAAGLFACLSSSLPSRRVKAARILAALAISQVIWFAWEQRTTSNRDQRVPHQWTEMLETVLLGNRAAVTASWLGDAGETHGFLNTAGYNPLLLKRTAEVLAAAQKQVLADVGQFDPAAADPRLLGMLRAAAVIPNWPLGAPFVIHNPLPRFLLLNQNVQVHDAAASLGEVERETFDPAHEVVLESAPVPAPASQLPLNGSVRLLSETTDSLELEADLTAPQILLITDAFSAGWQVTPVGAGTQQSYQVLPADHCLRAIPLAAGHHHFRLQYWPEGVVVGAWISVLSTLVWLACAICLVQKSVHRRPAPP